MVLPSLEKAAVQALGLSDRLTVCTSLQLVPSKRASSPASVRLAGSQAVANVVPPVAVIAVELPRLSVPGMVSSTGGPQVPPLKRNASSAPRAQSLIPVVVPARRPDDGRVPIAAEGQRRAEEVAAAPLLAASRLAAEVEFDRRTPCARAEAEDIGGARTWLAIHRPPRRSDQGCVAVGAEGQGVAEPVAVAVRAGADGGRSQTELRGSAPMAVDEPKDLNGAFAIHVALDVTIHGADQRHVPGGVQGDRPAQVVAAVVSVGATGRSPEIELCRPAPGARHKTEYLGGPGLMLAVDDPVGGAGEHGVAVRAERGRSTQVVATARLGAQVELRLIDEVTGR